jgi:hypothetical protein
VVVAVGKEEFLLKTAWAVVAVVVLDKALLGQAQQR